MKSNERARLNILQALQDLGATSEATAVGLKDVDHVVGDLSRYARANTQIVQSLLRDGLVRTDFEAFPLKTYLTSQGSTYLSNENEVVTCPK